MIFRRAAAGEQILLIQDGYGNWGFPKGHVEPGEEVVGGALRECMEETGLERLQVMDGLGSTDWFFRSEEVLVHKYCDYFLIEADPHERATPEESEGIQSVVWLSPEAALGRITYENARHILELGLERLSEKLGSSGSRGAPDPRDDR